MIIRSARPADAYGMAVVHVRSWQETYRGLVDGAVLDDPGFVGRRERWWRRAITEGAGGTRSIAVADDEGTIVGIASAGEPRDDDATWPVELFVIYLLSQFHGSGIADQLLDKVIGASAAALWVADPNPRAQNFYRRHGFVPDGALKAGSTPELRMVRPREVDHDS